LRQVSTGEAASRRLGPHFSRRSSVWWSSRWSSSSVASLR
jgi:hypothetical protein